MLPLTVDNDIGEDLPCSSLHLILRWVLLYLKRWRLYLFISSHSASGLLVYTRLHFMKECIKRHRVMQLLFAILGFSPELKFYSHDTEPKKENNEKQVSDGIPRQSRHKDKRGSYVITIKQFCESTASFYINIQLLKAMHVIVRTWMPTWMNCIMLLHKYQFAFYTIPHW